MLIKPSTLFTITRKWNYHCRPYIFNNFNFNIFHVDFKGSSFNEIGFLSHNKLLSSQSNGDKRVTTVSGELKSIIEQKKEKLRDKEKIIREKGSFILRDIKETKAKVKGRVEEIVERENVLTIPNLLCITRIALSPYLGLLIVQSNFDGALLILAFAAVTDLLDGWIARTWKSQSSKMGSFLDPMADKILIGTLFLSLTYVDLIPVILTGLIIARDAVLVASGFIIRYLSLPPPRTLSRYFDLTHATAQLAPTFISKVNTAVQLILVGSTLAAPVFGYVGHPALEALWYITSATTIASGISYALSKNTYKMLRKSGISKDQ